MRATIGWLGGCVCLAILALPWPAWAGGGGGGGGVQAVSVPALSPLAFAVAQLILIGAVLLRRRWRRRR